MVMCESLYRSRDMPWPRTSGCCRCCRSSPSSFLNEKSFRFRVVVDASPATFSSRRPLSRSRNAKETIATVTRATINRALALEVEDRRAMKVQISFHESGVRGGIRRFFFFAFFEQRDESLRKKKIRALINNIAREERRNENRATAPGRDRAKAPTPRQF